MPLFMLLYFCVSVLCLVHCSSV